MTVIVFTVRGVFCVGDWDNHTPKDQRLSHRSLTKIFWPKIILFVGACVSSLIYRVTLVSVIGLVCCVCFTLFTCACMHACQILLCFIHLAYIDVHDTRNYRVQSNWVCIRKLLYLQSMHVRTCARAFKQVQATRVITFCFVLFYLIRLVFFFFVKI